MTLPRKTVAASPFRRPAVLVWVLLGACSVGCQSAHYNASTMPMSLRAPATRGGQHMALSQLAGMAGGSSQIAGGDLLDLTVNSGMEAEVIPQPARVADDGNVDVPQVGPVAVAGLDPQQAADRIRRASIERGIYRNPQITVKVAERAVNYITILGAVAEPGTHELPRGASNLAAAIAAAGGFTEEAGTEVEVLRQSPRLLAQENPAGDSAIQQVSFNAPPLQRPTPQTERIDLAMVESGQRRDTRLGDQDMVMVHPAKKRVIHVAGLVRHPAQFEMPKDQDLHVLGAIAMAGGKSSPVADKVYVIRRLDEEQEPKVIQVSISKAKVDGMEDLRLAPGDLVSVESTVATGVVDTLSNVFRITAGVGGNLLSF